MSEDRGKMILYEHFELSALSDLDLIEKLKSSWGYDKNSKLKVLGRLRQVSNRKDDATTFFVIENLMDLNGEELNYPIANFRGLNTVYIGRLSDNKFKVGDYVKAEVVLSPLSERDKHGIPFALCVVPKTVVKLTKIPNSIIESNVSLHPNFIEDWIVDFLSKKHAIEIERNAKEKIKSILSDQKEVEGQLAHYESELDTLKLAVEDTTSTIEQNRDYLKALDDKTFKNQVLLKEVEAELERVLNTKGHIVSKLNEFIENKITILRDLDIVDEDVVFELVGDLKTQDEERVGYKLGEDFSDIDECISYIQAYLYDRGIMYRKDVLKNYFTLLNTRDLIVLAGDSGSGKTALVKYFAEAIGGKYYIVPVKPNWTSSEDLLGYYNPLEQNYLSTVFLDALIDAKKHPTVPYFICLDEMNLARVEYYFADFLSLLEEREKLPELQLYSQTEATHLVSETKNFLALVNQTQHQLDRNDFKSFVSILQDEEVNQKLHELCGFKDGDSLLKYHTRLRKSFASYLHHPSTIEIPSNVFFIGTVNIDETTHYLSPKVLDRAHVMRFSNPLLQDWDEVKGEIGEGFEHLDRSRPVSLSIDDFECKAPYPNFENESYLERQLIYITKKFLLDLGIEFGLRAIRQAVNYQNNYLKNFDIDEKNILNIIVRQKILPKLIFDGSKKLDEETERKDLLNRFRAYLAQLLEGQEIHEMDSALKELNNTIKNAEMNDWVINYWSK